MKTPHVLFSSLLAIGVMLPSPTQAQDQAIAVPGAVFAMTNDVDNNAVVAYSRAVDGTLIQGTTYSTGGRGSGGTIDPLAAQGALTLGTSHGLLFAANAGSGDITVFQVHGATLTKTAQVPSEGAAPVAIAQRGGLLYVVNEGGQSNVTGFKLGTNGTLTHIANSTQFLSEVNTGPGSVAFSPNGQILLVTEKITGKINSYAISTGGLLTPLAANSSAGPGLFSVTFAASGTAIASETGPPNGTNASAITSYSVASNGTMTAISTSVPTLGTATCWEVATPTSTFVYASSAGGIISGYSIGSNGSLTPIGSTIVANLPSGSFNLDIAMSGDGKFLYTLDSGTGDVSEFGINTDGTLTSIGSVTGLAGKAGVNGLAAY